MQKQRSYSVLLTKQPRWYVLSLLFELLDKVDFVMLGGYITSKKVYITGKKVYITGKKVYITGKNNVYFFFVQTKYGTAWDCT